MREVLFLLILLTSYQAFTQNKKYDVKCGERHEGVFDTNREWHDYIIKLEGGDNLKVYASSKYGDKLKLGIDIWTPANIKVSPFNYGHHQVETETGTISGSGDHKVVIFNFDNRSGYSTGHIGDYMIEFECLDINGNIKSSKETVSERPPAQPAYQEPEPIEEEITYQPETRVQPKIVNPRVTTSTTTFEEEPSTTISEEQIAQFVVVAFGETMQGSIEAGENQLFGFKMEIPADTESVLDFAIEEGDVPLEIRILDPISLATLFFVDLGNAHSIKSKIDFTTQQEYIVVVKESSEMHSQSGNTSFLVRLQ
jgi:hypothetical protein